MPDSSPHPRSDAAATRRWVERLERFAAGNHTVVAFCAAEGVSQSNFYLWRRRLAQPGPSPVVRSPTVVPIRIAPPPAPTTPVELALPSGTVVRFGEQTAEQLDLEPARFFVLRTVKKSYACRHCDPTAVPVEQRIRTAGPAQVGPIAKGLCGPGLLAHVVTAKHADHVPVHRLAGQLSRSGVTVARSTLGDWLFRASELLTPLYRLMHRRLLLSRVIHGDDTGVKLRVAGSDRTTKAHLWVCVGDADSPYVLFDFTADYTADGLARFLEGFEGYLQADALAQYEALFAGGEVKHVCCVAHARRKFVAASDAGDDRAAKALGLIGRLSAPAPDDESLALHDALDKLAELHPEKAEVVKLRYFAGLTADQAAAALGISPSVGDRHWA